VLIAWLGHLREVVFHFLTIFELPTLFVLVLIEEMGLPLPLPSDTLIAYAGAVHRHSVPNALAVIGVVSIACTLGSSVLYVVCRKGGPKVVSRLTKFLHLHPDRIARLESWFQRRGAVAIIVARLIPGLRIPATVMAGLANVPYRVFVPGTAAAAVIWSTFYYFLGGALRGLWRPIVGRLSGTEPGRLWGLLVILLILLALWFSLPSRRWFGSFMRRRRGITHVQIHVPPRVQAPESEDAHLPVPVPVPEEVTTKL